MFVEIEFSAVCSSIISPMLFVLLLRYGCYSLVAFADVAIAVAFVNDSGRKLREIKSIFDYLPKKKEGEKIDSLRIICQIVVKRIFHTIQYK